MTTLVWTVGVVLLGVLLSFTAYAAIVGGIGVLTGGRYVRCPRCGRHGLCWGGRLHERGCPDPGPAHQAVRVAHQLPHRVHFGHH